MTPIPYRKSIFLSLSDNKTILVCSIITCAFTFSPSLWKLHNWSINTLPSVHLFPMYKRYKMGVYYNLLYKNKLTLNWNLQKAQWSSLSKVCDRNKHCWFPDPLLDYITCFRSTFPPIYVFVALLYFWHLKKMKWETRVINFEYFHWLTRLRKTRINCIFQFRMMINSLLAFLVSSLASVAPLSRQIVQGRRGEVYLRRRYMADQADLFDPYSGKNSIFFCFVLFFTFIFAIAINSWSSEFMNNVTI